MTVFVSKPQPAIDLALGRARRHAATAAIAASLVPLSALPAGAVIAQSQVIVSASFSGGVETYTITNNSTSTITAFEIPEVNLGDISFFKYAGTGGALGYSGFTGDGWTVNTGATPSEFQAKGGFYVGTGVTPGAYIDVVNTAYGGINGYGGSATFEATVPFAATLNSQFDFNQGGTITTIDPPIPDTRTPVGPVGVPEPSTLAALGTGMLGLMTARRRRHG